MIDPALIIDAGLSHSGACVYAALAFLWFEHVTDAGKLNDLERRAGRKRLDPVVVTADELFALTGLKKDGVAARIRELETPRACIWRGCENDHPLVTVRRLGQGRGLRIQRFICGEHHAVPRRRTSSQHAEPKAAEDKLFPGGSPFNMAVAQEPAAVECRAPAESATTTGSDRTVVSLQNAEVPRSRNHRNVDLQNAALTPSRTRHTRALERGTDAFQNAPPPRSLLGNTEDLRTIKKATAGRARAAAVQYAAAEINETTERLVEKLLELARRKEPHYAIETARSVVQRLIGAALESGFEHDHAVDQLMAAVADHRVTAAANPVAFLIRGVVGDCRTQVPSDRFLLVTRSSTQLPKPPGYDEFAALPRDLQELLLERMRAGEPLDGAWLRQRDVTNRAAATARNIVHAERHVETTELPLCEALKIADPDRYRSRLEAIVTEVSLPPIFGSARSIDHPMLLGICRSRLEQQLVNDATAAQRNDDATAKLPKRVD